MKKITIDMTEEGQLDVEFSFKGEVVATAHLRFGPHFYPATKETWLTLDFSAGPVNGDGEEWLLREFASLGEPTDENPFIENLIELH